jgi:signal transduction histidine kinase
MAKILIVDDKESNLLALHNVLKSLDADIVQAMNGNDALRASLNHDFALAILDVQMPDMDGYELAALLRGEPRTRHVPIIFLSAVYFDDPYVFKGYSSGAVDFITKPFNPEILLSKVRVFLEMDAQKAEIVRQKTDLEKLVAQLELQIEARKKAEQEALKVRMLEALGTLAGGIAHDFNNMLAAVMGHIDLAQINLGNDKRVRADLEKAEKIIMDATELTSRFITFSGGALARRQVVSIERILSKSATAALADSNIEHEFSFQEGLWDVKADLRQMEQVVYVLVTNAREAMPQGGGLKIRAVNWEPGRNGDPTEPALPPGAYVKASISDQGPGIAKDDLDKIFDPYFSTKDRGCIKGMGLGLSIAHSIITQHDGYIQVESPSDTGATFNIYLPALKASERPMETGHDDQNFDR